MHRDGAGAGLVNAFVPLVDVTAANGGTCLLPRSHVRRHAHAARAPEKITPLLRAGEVLLFDYRILHYGRANASDAPRPIAYIVYAAKGARDEHNFPPTSLPAYCQGLRERDARLDRTLAALAALGSSDGACAVDARQDARRAPEF